ncbi:uncharacterized protein RBU33_012855 isoform 2-T3 [Hipposideros larvatus]
MYSGPSCPSHRNRGAGHTTEHIRAAIFLKLQPLRDTLLEESRETRTTREMALAGSKSEGGGERPREACLVPASSTGRETPGETGPPGDTVPTFTCLPALDRELRHVRKPSVRRTAEIIQEKNDRCAKLVKREKGML